MVDQNTRMNLNTAKRELRAALEMMETMSETNGALECVDVHEFDRLLQILKDMEADEGHPDDAPLCQHVFEQYGSAVCVTDSGALAVTVTCSRCKDVITKHIGVDEFDWRFLSCPER